MNSKLVLRHKDSLALREKQEINKRTGMRYLSLPCVTLSVFLVYWLIVCPIIFAVHFSFFSKKTRSSPQEALVYWIVAFSVWLVIMCVVLICWRRSQVRQNSEIGVISKYGSDSVEKPLGNVLQTSEDAESPDTKIESRDSESTKNDRESKKSSLLPLVIQKRVSGEDIFENTAVVHRHAERDEEEARLNVASDYVAKNPLQDYLQLVTVSPSEEGEVKSAKTPMSPRELFFIDLIRAAEEAERANSSEPRTYFFPSEATRGSDTKDAKKNATKEGKEDDTKHKEDAKDAMDSRGERNGTSTSEKSKRESRYFIANVESPICEKTEVFLRIDPDAGSDPAEVVVEKPVLLLQSTEHNSQVN